MYPNKPLINDLSVIYVPFFRGLSEETPNRRPVPTNSMVDDKKISEKYQKKKKKKDKYLTLSTWLSCRQDHLGDMADSVVKTLQGLCGYLF